MAEVAKVKKTVVVHDYEPRPDTKDYILVSDKGHQYIDKNGVRKDAVKGDTVALTDDQYANFKDKFKPAEQKGEIESNAKRVARLKAELAKAEAELADAESGVEEGKVFGEKGYDERVAKDAEDADKDVPGTKRTGNPDELKNADPSSAPKDVGGGGPEKSGATEVPKNAGSGPGTPSTVPGTGKPA